MTTATQKNSKPAIARKISGNLYDVEYPGHADFDMAVPYSYLRRLTRHGHTVTCHDEDGQHIVTAYQS